MASPARAAADRRSARKTTGSGGTAGRINAKRPGSTAEPAVIIEEREIAVEWREEPLVSAGRKAVRCGWVLALAGVAAAQSGIYLPTQARNVDFSAAGFTKPIKTGSALPGSCSVGELFFETTAPAGANLFACTSANTWSVQAGNGAGGSVGVSANGVLAGVRPNINVISGTGIQSVLADTGSQINVQLQIDGSVVQSKADEQGGGTVLCASSSGNSSTYTCALTPAAGGYVKGMVLHWIPDLAGAGGATSLNVNTLGAVPVKMGDGVTDPSAGDVQAGRMYVLWYDGTAFRMVTSASAASGGGSGGGAVSSVFGRTGAISAQAGDYNTAQVTESGNLYFTNARAQAAMSGLYQTPITTGTTAQYFRGDLSLATFPTTWAWTNLTGVPSTFNAGQILGAAIPSLAVGHLQYNGSALVWDPAAYLTGNQNIAVSGDCSGSGTTSINVTCAKANGTAFAPSATTDTTNASNITSGTLAHGRLPALVAGDIPNNAANTTGNAATSNAVVYTGLTASSNIAAGVLVKRDASTANQVDQIATTDVTWLGVTIAACTSGSACPVWRLGPQTVCVDGPYTSGDAAIASTTIAGCMHDSGTTRNGVPVVNSVGMFTASCSSSCTTAVVDFTPADRGTGGTEVLRGSICMTAGCGSESSMNGIMMNGSGTITACGFNLLTAPSGSSVTVAIQQNGTTVTSLTIATSATKVKTTGLSIAFADQDIFTWKITANDSGNSAQGGTVQCWR